MIACVPLRCASQVAALAVSFVSLAAFAQPPAAEPAPPQSVTVTGTRLDRATVARQAAAFVNRIGIARGQRPVARWEQPVCPRVLGLQETYGHAVEARMRAIALSVGIRVARQPCEPNIAVSFNQDAAGTVRAIAARAPGRLRQVTAAAREQLTTGLAPIRWWYVTGMQGADGTAPAVAPAPGTGGDGAEGGGSVIPGVDGGSHRLYNSSMIRTGASRVLLNATIIVDMDLVEGMPLDAVGSYAALVAFAEIQPAEPAPAQSILALFDENAAPPAALTAWDEALLRSLYRLPLDRSARRHRGALVNGLTDGVLGD